MYRLGEIEHSHRKFYGLLAGFIVLLAFGWFITEHFLNANTRIGQPPPTVTTHVSADTTPIKTYDTPLFSIQLPSDWKTVTMRSDIPQPTYIWQGTVSDDANRWISFYVDENVSELAVNRELYVQANGGTLNVLSDVSDNCTTFTGTATSSNGSTPAKWQGIDFLCDSSNYERDVVGIASPDGFNDVNLSGTGGSHHFFITYTDNSASPDYTIFVNALKSIRLK